MRIQVCDACKQVFKPYAKLQSEAGDVYEGNGLSFLVIERDGKKRPTFTADLCPDCNLKLRGFMKEMGLSGMEKKFKKDHLSEDGDVGELAASADYDIVGGEVRDA